MSAGETVEQVRVAAKAMRDGGIAGGPGRLSNIVFMGMGEPMGNYRSVLSAVRQISAMPPEGFGISARNITVSTVGVVPGIRRLAEEGIPVRLAVSLHAPSDELRDELVPMNKRFNTTQVLDAAHDYFLASKRRVSIEYALMRGINDQAEHARLLAKRLNHYGDDWAHVNPIPLNPIEGSRWTASKPEDEQRFLETLHAAGITATLRDTRGQDIDGACGRAGRQGTAGRRNRVPGMQRWRRGLLGTVARIPPDGTCDGVPPPNGYPWVCRRASRRVAAVMLWAWPTTGVSHTESEETDVIGRTSHPLPGCRCRTRGQGRAFREPARCRRPGGTGGRI